MAYTCTLKVLKPQPVMSIRGPAAAHAIPAKIAEFLSEAWGYVQQKGGRIVGPPFTRFHGAHDGAVDLEGGVPVENALPPGGRIQAGELPGGEAVVTTHVGPYDGLPEARAALEAWTKSAGRKAAGPAWQAYWTDPGEVKDSAKWQTEVVLPLEPA